MALVQPTLCVVKRWTWVNISSPLFPEGVNDTDPASTFYNIQNEPKRINTSKGKFTSLRNSPFPKSRPNYQRPLEFANCPPQFAHLAMPPSTRSLLLIPATSSPPAAVASSSFRCYRTIINSYVRRIPKLSLPSSSQHLGILVYDHCLL